MSRCYICDKDLVTPQYNEQLKNYEPCPECLDVIFSVFSDFPDESVGDGETISLAELREL